jgi:hypothetical protein
MAQERGKVVVDESQPRILLWLSSHQILDEGLRGDMGIVLAVVQDESVGVIDGQSSHQLGTGVYVRVDDHGGAGPQAGLEVLGRKLQGILHVRLCEVSGSRAVAEPKVQGALLPGAVDVLVLGGFHQPHQRIQEVFSGKCSVGHDAVGEVGWRSELTSEYRWMDGGFSGDLDMGYWGCWKRCG